MRESGGGSGGPVDRQSSSRDVNDSSFCGTSTAI